MTLIDPRDLDDCLHITITRVFVATAPDGAITETTEIIAENLPADIQLSLQVRTLRAEDARGTTDSAVWLLFCIPPAPLREGDRIDDGARTFAIESVGDWGSHAECTLRRIA